MHHQPFRRRAIAAGASCAIALAVWAVPSAAKEKESSAKESKRAVCTAAYSAYKSGAEHEKAGQMRDAREQFASCAQASVCGGLAPKCQARLDKLTAQMPTVVPVVIDENGSPRVDVQVKCDGHLLTSQLDGKGLPVEPGVHEFTFGSDKGVFATQKVLVIEGERNRPINVSLMKTPAPAAATATVEVTAPAAAPAPDAATSPAPAGKTADSDKPAQDDSAAAPAPAANGATVIVGSHWSMPKSVVPYLLGGVGIAGLAAGGLLTYWGNRDNSDLESQCRPSCQPSSLDHIRAMYIASDVAWAVGGGALFVSGILFASSRSTDTPARAATHTPHVAFDVHPTRSGAFGSISGAF